MLMLKLALRNLLRNRRRTVLTLLSLLGGFFLLSVSLSVQTGSYEQVISFFTKDSTGHVQIAQVGYQEKPSLYKSVPVTDTFYQHIIEQPLVTGATPRIVSGALAYGLNKSFPVQVMGVDVQREGELTFLKEKVRQGSYFSSKPNVDGYYQVMLGAGAARQLELGIGDELVLISQGADGSIANDLYLISAIIGSAEGAQGRTVYLPLQAAQDFFVLPNQAHYWYVLTTDHNRANQLAINLNRMLRTLDGQDTLEAVSWQVVASEFYNTMQADIKGGYISYYIIVFLVSIGVLNTVLMSVLERTGEFGVLKAIGTSPRRIFALIVAESLVLAVVSCLLGFLLFSLFNIFLVNVGISVPPQEISGVAMEQMRGSWQFKVLWQPFVIVMLAAILVAIWPAFRAARIVPIEAMRQL